MVTMRVRDEKEVCRRQVIRQSPRVDVDDELFTLPAEGRLLVPGKRIEHLLRPPLIVFRSTPMPSISISTTSPTLRYSGGVRAKPTPAGVPVMITSPGHSSQPAEISAMSRG